MQVRHILQNKGHDVVAVAASADLCEAVRILSQHRIGALLVRAQGGALAGILSERDVVRAIAATGGAALSQSVQQHMTAKPITCTEDNSVETIMEVMTSGRFRHVPVLDRGGDLCGMISIGDVVKSRIAAAVGEADALRGYISAA